jgi:hypothetical protein
VLGSVVNDRIKDNLGIVHWVDVTAGFDVFSLCKEKWALCYPQSWLSAIPPEKVVVRGEWEVTCLGCIAEEP